MNIEGKEHSLLTFRVGPVLCCAPSFPVRSIITPPKLTHPPGSDTSQPGIFKHGSHIVKVLDLRQKFGINTVDQSHPGNLIITVFEKESFAFWVDQILDVFDFPSEGWGNLPPALPRGVFTRTLLLNKKIHLYSEFEKLATINDLGYLKHYIQHLKKQEQKKTTDESENVTASTASTIIHEQKPHTRSSVESATSHSITKNDSTKYLKQKKLTAKTPIQNHKQQNTTVNLNNTAVDRTISKSSTTSTFNTVKKEPVSPNSVTKTVQKTAVNKATTVKPKQKVKAQPLIVNRTVTANKEFTPQTSSAKSNYTGEEDDDSSNVGIVIFILLMLLFLGAGVYYVLFSDDDKRKYKPGTGYEKPYTKKNPIQTQNTSNPDITIPAITVTPEIKENIAGDIQTNIEAETVPQAIESKPLDTETYRADISKIDNEITITLRTPATEVQLLKPVEPAATDKIEEAIIEPVTEIEPVEIFKKVIPPKKVIREVIHTVVKGDTLWAIAKKYVNDPFLYPELARLSNIKNPHRIYPGNRVRIRFIDN